MKKRILAILALLALSCEPAIASNCTSYTYNFVNGTTADANQVNSNFNTILNCANNNLAHNGANADITSLAALSTALTVPQGGTGDVTLTAHGVLIGAGTSPVAATSAGTAGQALISGGAGADPSFGAVGVTGGGTGLSAVSADQVPTGTAANTYTAKSVPNCVDTGGNHINYTTATHAWSCGTSGGGGGGPTLGGNQTWTGNNTWNTGTDTFNTATVAFNTAPTFNAGQTTTGITTSDTAVTINSCGTSPTLNANSTNLAGRVVEGTSAIGCTVVWSSVRTNLPFCVVTYEGAVSSMTWSAGSNSMATVHTSASNKAFDWICIDN